MPGGNRPRGKRMLIQPPPRWPRSFIPCQRTTPGTPHPVHETRIYSPSQHGSYTLDAKTTPDASTAAQLTPEIPRGTVQTRRMQRRTWANPLECGQVPGPEPWYPGYQSQPVLAASVARKLRKNASQGADPTEAAGSLNFNG